ncbi:MAG: type II toxin-antitoxin system VapC family toxin [Armatimonadetes bacterium]|nr:type II toxin-antitoxin system VapC family toxin [Armatimonadota bacterium]
MVFLGTNVLVYYTTPASPHHADAVQAMAGAPATEGASISRQVLRDYLSEMSRTQVHGGPQPPQVLAAEIASFESGFKVLEDGPPVTAKLVELIQQVAVGGKQIHDANLVATMLVHGVSRLVTANGPDFRRFPPWIDVLPLPGGLPGTIP